MKLLRAIVKHTPMYELRLRAELKQLHSTYVPTASRIGVTSFIHSCIPTVAIFLCMGTRLKVPTTFNDRIHARTYKWMMIC